MTTRIPGRLRGFINVPVRRWPIKSAVCPEWTIETMARPEGLEPPTT